MENFHHIIIPLLRRKTFLAQETKKTNKAGKPNPLIPTGGPGDKKKSPMNDPARTIFMWALIAVAVFLALRMAGGNSQLRETQLTYSQFRALLAISPNHIVKAEIQKKGLNQVSLLGETDDAAIFGNIPGAKAVPGSKTFSVNLPFIDSELLKEFDSKNLQYSIVYDKMNWGDILINVLPWVLIILFWLFMFRQMQAGQRGVFSFGKSKAKLHNIDRPQNTFADVAGVDEAKNELEEIIEFLKNPKKFNRLGGKIPKGVLLLGPPGTGKTLLARCVAGEAGVPFLSMSGSDFVEMFVGVGASRVRDLFENAKRNSPCIIFIDEIDAVGRQRGAGLGGGHDEREQTLNQMLV